ncbi:hypothetical protein ACM66B_002461 [Microbotryomycetes sp. NB124-2]
MTRGHTLRCINGEPFTQQQHQQHHARIVSSTSIGESPRANGSTTAHRPPSWITSLLKTGPPTVPPKNEESVSASTSDVAAGKLKRMSNRLSRATAPTRRGANETSTAHHTRHSSSVSQNSDSAPAGRKDVRKLKIVHHRTGQSPPGSPRRATRVPKRPVHPTALPDADFVAFRRKPSLTNAKRISLPPGTLSFTTREPPRRLRDGSWDWDGGDRTQERPEDLRRSYAGTTAPPPRRPSHRRTQSADAVTPLTAAPRLYKAGPSHSLHLGLSSIWEDELETIDKGLPARPTLSSTRKGSVASHRKPVPALLEQQVSQPFASSSKDNVHDRVDKGSSNVDESPAKSSVSQLDLPDFPPPPLSPAIIEVTSTAFSDEDDDRDTNEHAAAQDHRHSVISTFDPRRLSVPLSIGMAPSETDTHSMYSNNDDMEYRIVSSYFEPSLPATPRSTCFGQDALAGDVSGLAISGLSCGLSPRSSAVVHSPTLATRQPEADLTPRTNVDAFMPVHALHFTLPFQDGTPKSPTVVSEETLVAPLVPSPVPSNAIATPPARALAAFLGNTTRLVYKSTILKQFNSGLREGTATPRLALSLPSPTSTSAFVAAPSTIVPSPQPPSSTFTDITRFSNYTFGNPLDEREDDENVIESPNTSFQFSTKRSSSSNSSVSGQSSTAIQSRRQQQAQERERTSVSTERTTTTTNVGDELNEFSFSSSARKSLLTYEPFGLSGSERHASMSSSMSLDKRSEGVTESSRVAKERPKTWFAGRFVYHDVDYESGAGHSSHQPVSPRSKGVYTRNAIEPETEDWEADEGSTISPEADAKMLDAYIARELGRRARERAQRWAEERWELAGERIELEQAFQVGLAL